MHRTGLRRLTGLCYAPASIALVALALIGSGCSKKNDVTGINGSASGSLSIGVAGGFINTNRSNSILEFQALLDNVAIQDTSYAPATNLASLDGSSHSISHGQHTLTLKIVRQTSSSNTYSTYALVVLVVDPSTGGVIMQMTPADQVASGTQISIPFSF